MSVYNKLSRSFSTREFNEYSSEKENIVNILKDLDENLATINYLLDDLNGELRSTGSYEQINFVDLSDIVSNINKYARQQFFENLWVVYSDEELWEMAENSDYVQEISRRYNISDYDIERAIQDEFLVLRRINEENKTLVQSARGHY